ncbi:MAG: S41 family peptidase [Thermoleophilaceae bacterium]|nr:S41 family peptidase [Thermoleophilaceae bacterium]
MHRNALSLAALAAALAIFCGGLWLGGHPSELPAFIRDPFTDGGFALRSEVIDALEERYYRDVPRSRLEQASLEGMVRSLNDPYSHYFTPAEAKQFSEDVNGEFEGVGLSVRKARQGLLVVTAYPKAPAARAGIRAGDVIVAVDGRSIAGEETDVATAKIKGRAGTSVSLTYRKAGKGPRRTVTVKRERIDLPVASGRMVATGGPKVGYVALRQFTDGAHGALRARIDSLLRGGARGLVLDLRGNGGGLLQEGRLVASIFVPKGLIVSTRGRGVPETKLNATGNAIPSRIPVVVLVDRGTASAAEIVTGALRDHGRATVVGTRTFGKGVFQEIEPLSNGGALDLTVGRYYLPDGENIQETGIEPAVKARDDPGTKRDEGLDAALRALRRKLARS